ACGSREVEIRLFVPETTSLLYEHNGMIGVNGNYSIPEIDPGEYDIYFKVKGYLTRKVSNVTVNPGLNTLSIGGITPGDVNNNYVNLSDISQFNYAFGSQIGQPDYYQIADYSCDGFINIIDLSLLGQWYGTMGDSPGN